MRYRIVVAVCRWLGHPTRRFRQLDKTVRVSCPCGYMDDTETPGGRS